MTDFFYDSYPIIEYINDNPKFIRYFEEHDGILTLLNVLEVYYAALRDLGKEKADTVLNTIYPLIVHPSKEIIQKAMAFRLEQKRKNLSYADCIGYILAKELKIMFLTGDEQFRGLQNVEFVKAKV